MANGSGLGMVVVVVGTDAYHIKYFDDDGIEIKGMEVV